MLAENLKKRAYRDFPLDRLAEPILEREHIDPDALEQLAATIGELGVLEPILISCDGTHYRPVFGNRRIQAARLAKLKSIPAFVVDNLSGGDALVVALLENMQREDMAPLDEAEAIQILQQEYRLAVPQIAQRLGKSPSFITNRLSLLKLPAEVKAKIEAGKIGPAQATVIATLPTPGAQKALAEQVEQSQLSLPVIQKIVDEADERRREEQRTKDQKRHQKQTAARAIVTPLTLPDQERQLQEVVARGEKLLKFLQGIVVARWSLQNLKRLRTGIAAINRGIQNLLTIIDNEIARQQES